MIQKKEIKSLWEEQLSSVFENKKTDMDMFLSILSIVVFDRFDENIGKLYSVVNDMEVFTKIINTFSGLTVKVPDRDEFKDAISIALAYHYKHIKNMTWDEIKKELPYETNLPLKTGKGISKLNNTIKEQLDLLLSE